MGALTLLCGFFFLFPVLALLAVLVAVVLLAGILAGTVSLIAGIMTYFAAASVPGGVVKLIRSR